MKPEFKEQKLAEVDENMIHTWIYIRETYSIPALCKCLEVFAANKGLIDWLKEATNSKKLCLYSIYVCGICTKQQRCLKDANSKTPCRKKIKSKVTATVRL